MCTDGEVAESGGHCVNKSPFCEVSRETSATLLFIIVRKRCLCKRCSYAVKSCFNMPGRLQMHAGSSPVPALMKKYPSSILNLACKPQSKKHKSEFASSLLSGAYGT
ncbi:uncharacterized protein [Dermacentor andersoni]|uniref:uncharacterized protein n=1 Tax=Dermacentor andersoni TaxID=34620 RepID=UPI002415F639|nr:uncharacterized protein LOC129384052 [Dermacentor andersoni]